MQTTVNFIIALVFLIHNAYSVPSPKPTPDPQAVPTPTGKYPYKEQVDHNGSYFLFWDRNETHVTMEVHVRTYGYVGFGLSPNGNMYPADIVIGWVKNGKTYFTDRHSTVRAEPAIDKSQDWILLHGEENSFGTVLKFTRKINTCDPDDIEITEATMRVIYSYHSDDPVSETGLPYHGGHSRGARSVMFLSKSEKVQLPSDAISIDFVNNKFHVPAADTTYQCTVFDLNSLNQKHHLIHFEPIVQPGHEELVHHIVVYKCPIDRKYINETYMCFNEMYRDARPCAIAYLAWAVGGEAYYFPENIGLPVAEPNDHDLYIMQLHYNNPGMKTDYVDSSGMRLTVTKKLRSIEAGEFIVGIPVSPRFQIVPPQEPSFTTTGYCSADCLRKGMGNNKDGIHVFSIFQHAHLLAKGIKTRLIRNGVELKPIADDSSYDFDFQDVRRVNRTIMPGDSIIIECNYNSMGKTKPTYAGESTHEEMCISFLYYYPRIDLRYCESGPAFDNVPVSYTHINDYFKIYNWTSPRFREEYKKTLAESKHLTVCGGDWGKTQLDTRHVVYPHTPYVEPSKCQSGSH